MSQAPNPCLEASGRSVSPVASVELSISVACEVRGSITITEPGGHTRLLVFSGSATPTSSMILNSALSDLAQPQNGGSLSSTSASIQRNALDISR
jgi:hypothetical protein